ncbi:hypothetical protein AOR10_24465, partial [Vibrio alginolyticus]|uniref:hypothetical protein n=1 Tax=Vibrio alginolyticus TaxID=663 RepID=UPI0006DAE0EE
VHTMKHMVKAKVLAISTEVCLKRSEAIRPSEFAGLRDGFRICQGVIIALIGIKKADLSW